MKHPLTFKAVKARQSEQHKVFVFCATAKQVFDIARIDRAGRTDHGDLFGFQRPQVSQHIHEIRDYLKQSDSVLPNSVVLAFLDRVNINDIDDGLIEVSFDTSEGPPGWIVDGQQRLTALQPLENRDFQVFVSAIVCNNEDDLKRQFILINNTRALPKELIYELLPTVSGLPRRLSSRSFAADLTAKLNYHPESSLKGQIRQHTNPSGVLSSNAIQRVVMNSRGHGAIRDFIREEDAADRAFNLLNDFYGAVQDVFAEEWVGMGPKTSRLKHGAGLVSLGYVMETAYGSHGARNRRQFADKIECLKPHTAWVSGHWNFPSESRPWDRLQNTQPDIRILSDFLVRIVRDQGVSEEMQEMGRRREEQRIEQTSMELQ
tara:strand:+ start:1592 stop:2716 length:1125 start_codon:yes stop_codon:yes gene_type:complete